MTPLSYRSVRNCTVVVFGFGILALGLPADASDWRDSCLTSELPRFDEINYVMQHELQRDVLNVALELDGDGTVDQIHLERTQGGNSNLGLTIAEATLSESETRFKLKYYFSIARMIDITPVPEALQGDDSARVRQAMEEAVFNTVCATPDPSLEWFLSDRAVTWHKGLPRLPINYSLRFSTVPVPIAHMALNRFESEILPLDQPVWVTYKGAMHGGRAEVSNSEAGGELKRFHRDFSLLATSPEYKVWITRRGVVVTSVSREAYAWIYVNDSFKGWEDLLVSATVESDTITVHVDEPLDPPMTQIIRVDIGLGTVSEIFDNHLSTNSEDRRLRCQRYLDEGQFTAALITCHRLAEEDPRDADARYVVGTIFEAKGLPRFAKYEYQKAIELDGNHVEAAARLEVLEKAASEK